MVKSYSFNPLGTINTTILQETSNLYHIIKYHSRTFTSEQFYWFIQLCKEMLQHFARFWHLFLCESSCHRPLFFFSRSLWIFMATSDWLLNQLRIRIAYYKFQRKQNGSILPKKKTISVFNNIEAYNRSVFAGISTGYVTNSWFMFLAVCVSNYDALGKLIRRLRLKQLLHLPRAKLFKLSACVITQYTHAKAWTNC